MSTGSVFLLATIAGVVLGTAAGRAAARRRLREHRAAYFDRERERMAADHRRLFNAITRIRFN